MSEIHTFNHHAMATHFQVRIADQDETYATQTAQAAFALTDQLESRLSRFRVGSDISRLAHLAPGESSRLSEPVLSCLEAAKKMEAVTLGGFSITAAALQCQPTAPQWTLRDRAIHCQSGRLEFDLGAIGKGFAIDRMGGLLREWSCPAFLLVSGGSSILAGEAPGQTPGWSCGLGENNSPRRYWLKNASLSGSGLAVKGNHILNPRTGQPARRQHRAWALCDTAAESDALSTACMVLEDAEIAGILAGQPSWLVFLAEDESVKILGKRSVPPSAPS